MTAYISYELDYSFDDTGFKTVSRLFNSFDEALKIGCIIADMKDEKKSVTIRVRRLDHD